MTLGGGARRKPSERKRRSYRKGVRETPLLTMAACHRILSHDPNAMVESQYFREIFL
jgi:hypothetical protein